MTSRFCIVLLTLTFIHCGSVSHIYKKADYQAWSATSLKRIAVGSWASEADTPLDQVLLHVTTDLVKLRTHYLVYNAQVAPLGFAALCSKTEGDKKPEAVLLVRALRSSYEADEDPKASKVNLELSLELYRCQDGALIWRATADDEDKIDNHDLAQLTDIYTQSLGPLATRWSSMAFSLLQRLVAALPNPSLNDEDILEKIENES